MRNYEEALLTETRSYTVLEPHLRRLYGPYRLITDRQQQLTRGDLETETGLFVELKADGTLYRRVNAFIEIYSNRSRDTPGWAVVCQADRLVYHFTQRDWFLELGMQDLKKLLPRIQSTFPLKKQQAFKQQNDTWGCAVPVAWLENNIPTRKVYCGAS